MCRPASFIVTKTAVLWSKNAEAHETIIEENKLDDKSTSPEFVRVEISPVGDKYDAPLAEWVFRVDQDILPAWWDAADGEARVRAQLPAWAAKKVVTTGHVVLRGDERVIAVCGNASAVLCDNASATLYDNSSVELHGNARATLYDNSRATLYDNSSAELRGNARATLYDNSRATLRGNSSAELYNNASATLRGNSSAELYNNASAVLCDNARATLYSNSSAVLCDNASATLYSNSSATLRGNSSAELCDNALVESVNDGAVVTAYIPLPLCIIHSVNAVLIDRSGDTVKVVTGAMINCDKH